MTQRKRVFDVVLSALGLALTSPLFAVVALLIKLEDGGPVFFRQERVGLHGSRFWIWKFRSMVGDAESRGGQLTIGGDSRVTRVGERLRWTKIDELPQLLNVLKGEMSIVGPRPEVPRYVERYSPEHRRVLDLRPGMTDLASIRFRREAEILAHSGDPEGFYVSEIMPEKISINLTYARSATVWTDLGVVARTFAALFVPPAEHRRTTSPSR